ncbi:hypothetical protein F2P81_010290 [Scophthalmus maximus]|uniref:Uncharacterized protein n=1 Tax=Scophthalmus maximus TaxID=52904 RepID=A0A6A4SQG0_SCOMX|nr:hypothetical protein F2P81_010290 [Scophthalmus maximus]
MSRVVPTGRILNDKVDSSEGVDSSFAKEEISHPDHEEQTNKRPLSFLLPLPRLQSSLPSPACPPSDQVYLQASAIFQHLREEKPVPLQHLHYGRKADLPRAESGDKPGQRRAYQLAFDTLKCMTRLSCVNSLV